MLPANTMIRPADFSGPTDVRQLQRRLVLWVALAMLATLLVLAGVLVLANTPAYWRGLLAAGVASTLAAAASLPPLLLTIRRGLNAMVAGYFAASALRLAISLGGCLVAVYFGAYPAAPTLLLMVPFYFATLAAESAVVSRALWNARG